MGLLRTLHAWAGAGLALILVVLGLTGALLVFEDDWIRLTLPDARGGVRPTPLALGAAAERLEAGAAGEVRSVVFARPDLGVHRVYFDGERHAYALPDGRLAAAWTGDDRIEAWVFDLHHYLLAGDPGKIVAGVCGLLGAALVLTGLVVWLPAWRSFAGRLWPASGKRRDLLAAHRDLGMIFAAPLLLLCLTGGGIVFHKTTQGWFAALAPGAEAPRAPVAGVGDVNWPQALAAAQTRFPDAQIRMAIWPAKPGAPAVIRMKQPDEWHPNGRTQVFVDPSTGRVLQTIDAQRLGGGIRAYNGFYPLHAAAVGGRLYDLVVAASGLALAALGAVGLWSFLIKPRRRRLRRAAAAE